MHYDPTPDAVRLFRVNAIGMSISVLALFAAMFWWMGDVFGAMGELSWLMWGIMIGSAVFAVGMHLLPALVPRRQWGYVVAWLQIAMALTSGTATLPTIPVLIQFAKSEVRSWFDGRPVGPLPPATSATRATMTALIGYYAIISALPLAIAAYVGKLDSSATKVEVAHELRAQDRVEVRRGKVETVALDAPEEIIATKLTTEEPWALSHQPLPTAVTVWASTCGACTHQLRAIAKDPLPPGTQHVTLALDCDRNLGDVRQKLGRSNLRSEALCHVDGVDIDVLPTTILYDANGVRRATFHGSQSPQTLNDAARAVELLR